jgi:hypothetical protein
VRGTQKAAADAQAKPVPSDPIKPTLVRTIDGMQSPHGTSPRRDAEGILTGDQGASLTREPTDLVDRASYKDHRLILSCPRPCALRRDDERGGTEPTGTPTQGGHPPR